MDAAFLPPPSVEAMSIELLEPPKLFCTHDNCCILVRRLKIIHFNKFDNYNFLIIETGFGNVSRFRSGIAWLLIENNIQMNFWRDFRSLLAICPVILHKSDNYGTSILTTVSKQLALTWPMVAFDRRI